jgi:two-component system, HptB-dependent secretion and biofilm response regulator
MSGMKFAFTIILKKPGSVMTKIKEQASTNNESSESEKAQQIEMHKIQEELAFKKELNILRNDFYYQAVDCKKCGDESKMLLIDALYSPLDILSGDAYSLRDVGEHGILVILVDGMGKGISASLSAILMTSFINYKVDTMMDRGTFKFKKLIKSSMRFIRAILLEDEMISVDFSLVNKRKGTLKYAKFAMPPTLLQDVNGEIIKIKSNNAPMNRYDNRFEITKMDIAAIEKFLFYTDGLVENSTTEDAESYEAFIQEDFQSSFIKQEFLGRYSKRIKEQEDDVTLIFINKFIVSKRILERNVFASSLEALQKADMWYESVWEKIDKKQTGVMENAQIVFTEMMMNAYEHGNLAIGSAQKQRLLQEDTYFSTLLAKELLCDKKIYVEIEEIEYKDMRYILTKIVDEGIGFDTNSLNKIFRNSKDFHGRGVYLSKQSSLGIYYNAEGNAVIFFHKVPK